MSTATTWSGTGYTIPAVGDASWGANVTSYLLALSAPTTGALSRTGGAFTLTAADILFGSSYGLQSLYYKSNSANLAASGVLRLANADVIAWRNGANNADITLSLSSNVLQFNGVSLVDLTSVQTLTNKTLTAPVIATISNAGTLTLPTSTDTLVGRATTDTLTNKTLTAPVIGTISNTGTLTLPTSTDTLVGRATADTLTNKTITGGTLSAITGLGVRDTSAAFDVTVAATSSSALTAGRTLTVDMVNAANTIKIPPLSNFSTLADGAAGTVLSTLGSGGGYSWASALTSTLNQYNLTVGNASNAATSVNTNLLGDIKATTTSQTYTVTNATPGVFTVTAHGFATGDKVYVTATQNGFTLNTTYWVYVVTANTFQLCSSLANAVAGTGLASSGTTAGTVVGGGFVLTSGVKGATTNSTALPGYVGEFLDGTAAPALTTSPVAYVSLSLGPGDWDVSGSVVMNAGGTANNYLQMGISTSSGSFSGTQGKDYTYGAVNTTSSVGQVVIPRLRFSVSATTTIYLNAASNSAANSQSYCYMSARRMR